MASLALLAAFAYSKKIKSDRDTQRAIAKKQAEIAEKSKITNYAIGDNGIFVVNKDTRLDPSTNDRLYGFTIGTSGQINKFPDTEKARIDLYESPVNKGELITKQQFNSLNKGYSSIDMADSTTATKYPLGSVVAQRIPTTNELVYMKGYNAFKEDQNVETKYLRLDKNTNKFVDVKEGEKATHTQIIKTVGNSVTRETPVKIEVDKQQKTFVRYYDENKELTTDVSKIKFSEKVTTIDGQETDVGKLESFTPTKGKNIEVQIFVDKDGNNTTDRKKAVKVRIDTFDYEGNLVKQGKEEDYSLVKPEDKPTSGRVEYRTIALKPNAKGIYEESIVSEGMAMSRANAGTHKIIGYRTVNEKGVPGEFKPYNPIKDKNSMDAAINGKDIVTTLTFSKGTKTQFGKTQKDYFPIYRQQSPGDRLQGLHDFLVANPQYTSQINTNDVLYKQVSSILKNNLQSFFQGEAVGITEGDNVAFSERMPRTPDGAFDKAFRAFPEFAKIKGFNDITKNAAGFGEMVIASKIMANAKDGEFNIPTVKGTLTRDGKVFTTFSTQGLPLKYKPIVSKIANIVGQRTTNDRIGLSIERLIKYDTNEDGSLKKEDRAGKKVLVASQDQPVLDFVEQLDSTLLGKKINGREATFLDAFASMVHPFPSTTQIGKVNEDIQKDIVSKFAALASYDDAKMMSLIESFTAKNTTATRLLMEQFYGKDFNEVQVRKANTDKQISANNALSTIDSMERTYYTEDGQFIDINTQQGELITTVVGGIQTVSKIKKGITTLFKGGNVLDIVTTDGNKLANSLVNQSDEYDMADPNNEKELEARQRNNERFENLKNVIAGTGDINSFISGLDRKTQAALKGEKSTEVLRKLAIRQYHKYMLAYQLAAAIQGGTGGRTISDQDVENILRSLNFGFFTPAAIEVATLGEARKMMEKIYNHSTALLSPDTSKVFAALKTRQFLEGQDRGRLYGTIQARRKFILGRLARLNPKNNSSSKGTGGTVSNFAKEKRNRIESLILGNE